MRLIKSSSSQKKTTDKGFTLVELIIVMGIIAVMTGISFVTVTMMNSSRAKEAGTTFETELTDMITKSKNQICYDNSGTPQALYKNYMEVYQETNGIYHLVRGYYDPNTDTYTPYADSSGNLTEDTALSSRVVVCYEDTSGVSYLITSEGSLGSSDADDYSVSGVTNNVRIVYDNYGYCTNGAGTFNFHKKNGSTVASVSVRKNGSHQSN
jgi:prepilin-type N-terminal cleavage/methylation domain-containing protein